MKEELKLLEGISENIFKITEECTGFIPKDTDDGKIIFQCLSKLLERLNAMQVKAIKKEEL